MRPYPATSRQQDALRFIAGYVEAHGVAPTLREIARGVGVTTKTSAQRLLTCLIERGYVRRRAFFERDIAILVNPDIPRAPDGAPLYFVKPNPAHDSPSCARAGTLPGTTPFGVATAARAGDFFDSNHASEVTEL